MSSTVNLAVTRRIVFKHLPISGATRVSVRFTDHEYAYMSEVAVNQPKSKSPRSGTDRIAFAQVERWMALIREISLEQAKN